MFDGRFRAKVDRSVSPLGAALRRTRLTPDHLTALGLTMAVPTAVMIGSGRLILGLVLLIASAVPDLLDGALAKASGTASVRGAFFDSVSDRVTDALVLGGFAWYLQSRHHGHAAMLPFAILAVSMLVSYERAKAESLGLAAKGGLMERAERIVVLCIALAFSGVMVPLLWVMLALTSLTALQRFLKVWHQASRAPAAPSAAPSPAPTAPPRSSPLEAPRPRQPVAGSGAMAERWRAWLQAGGSETGTPLSHRFANGPRRRTGGRWQERRQTWRRAAQAGDATADSAALRRRPGNRRP